MHTLSTKHVGYNKSSFEFGFVVLLLKAKRLTRLLQFQRVSAMVTHDVTVVMLVFQKIRRRLKSFFT